MAASGISRQGVKGGKGSPSHDASYLLSGLFVGSFNYVLLCAALKKALSSVATLSH